VDEVTALVDDDGDSVEGPEEIVVLPNSCPKPLVALGFWGIELLPRSPPGVAGSVGDDDLHHR
jgi:hypothetical protein